MSQTISATATPSMIFHFRRANAVSKSSIRRNSPSFWVSSAPPRMRASFCDLRRSSAGLNDISAHSSPPMRVDSTPAIRSSVIISSTNIADRMNIPCSWSRMISVMRPTESVDLQSGITGMSRYRPWGGPLPAETI